MTRSSRTVVTIGNFDGVHLGHLELVGRATSIAAGRGLEAVAVTFDPHPAAVLGAQEAPAALQTVEERVAMLRSHGLSRVEVISFDEQFAAQSAERFVSDLLVERLRAEVVVVGENFRFGAGADGDVATLAALGSEHGFSVDVVPLVGRPGELARPVSSSDLRALLAAGDLEAVNHGLGRSFTVTGEVVRGEGRGRTLGVPTANVAIGEGRALPADGVYACWAWLGTAVSGGPTGGGQGDPMRVPAVVNVGWRPTFGGTTEEARTVEAHLLLDAAGGSRPWPGGAELDDEEAGGPDLYGRTLSLAFEARIRGEERFDGPDALVQRIGEDVVAARTVLGTH